MEGNGGGMAKWWEKAGWNYFEVEMKVLYYGILVVQRCLKKSVTACRNVVYEVTWGISAWSI